MSSKIDNFSTVDPFKGMTGNNPGEVYNLLKGKWTRGTLFRKDIPDPMDGENFLNIPDTTDYSKFIDSLDIKIKPRIPNMKILKIKGLDIFLKNIRNIFKQNNNQYVMKIIYEH